MQLELPPESYSELVEKEVYQDILDFHEKCTYIIHESTSKAAVLHNFTDQKINSITGNQLPIWPNGQNQRIKMNGRDVPISRGASCETFESREIDFLKVERLLSNFCSRENCYKRYYPSGGALYPIEVFCCRLNSRVQNWPGECDVLHLLPYTKCYEPLPAILGRQHLQNAIVPPALSDIGDPSIALVYVAFLPKNIGKYRYRGYRLSILEAGSMYMLANLAADHIGLRNRVWAGFCEHMVTLALGLHPSLFAPLCVTLLGGADESN